MIDLHGTEDLPDHQNHISGVPLANLRLSGRLTPVKLYCLSNTGPLKLRRTNSNIPLQDLDITKWRNFFPVLCILYTLGLMVTFLVWPRNFFGLVIALSVGIIVVLAVCAFLWLRFLLRSCAWVTELNVKWLYLPFKFTVRSPSGISDPTPEGPLYAECTSDTPLRYCSFNAFCLPVLRKGKAEYDGLLLKAAARGEGYYERVGTFYGPNLPLVVMLESAPQVSFVLT
jgi:hypothetical protein